MSYTQLSAGVRVESSVSLSLWTREPRDLVQSFQYANGPPPAATHRQRDDNNDDDDPNVHMSICSYRPTEIFRFRLALRRRGSSEGAREKGEGVQERGCGGCWPIWLRFIFGLALSCQLIFCAFHFVRFVLQICKNVVRGD